MEQNPQRRYVVFDRSTGAVLGTYGVTDGDTGEYRPQSPDEIGELFRDLVPTRGAADRPPEIGVLEIEVDRDQGGDPGRSRGDWVDVKNRRLMRKLVLRLEVDRAAIKGDGKDSVEIAITATDQKDKVVKDFDGELLITTTHGRLSATGGRVKARGGKASITLTSTVETIHRVSVSASDPARRCNTGSIVIEFV